MMFDRPGSEPSQLDHCRNSMLKPGWAGKLSPDEFVFIKSELRQSSSLRRRWGFRPSAKRLSERRIRDIAREGLRAIGR